MSLLFTIKVAEEVNSLSVYDFITKYTDFFLLKKCEKLLHCKSFSHFLDKK